MRWLACFLFLCALLSLLGSFTFQRFFHRFFNVFLFILQLSIKNKINRLNIFNKIYWTYTCSIKKRFEFPQMCSNWRNEMKEVRYLHFKISFLIDSMTEVYIAESKTCTMLTSFELTCWWNSVFIKKNIKRKQKLYDENEARFCSLFFGTAIYDDMKKERRKSKTLFLHKSNNFVQLQKVTSFYLLYIAIHTVWIPFTCFFSLDIVMQRVFF